MSDRLKRMVRRLKPLQGWVEDRAIAEIHIMLDGQVQARTGAGADWQRAKVAPKDVEALMDAVSSGASANNARGERRGAGVVIAEVGAHRWLSLSEPLARRGAALYVLRVRHPRLDEAALIDAGLVTQAALDRVKEALRGGHGVVIAGPPESGQRALLSGLLEGIGDDRHAVLLEGFNDLDTEGLSLTSLKRALIPAEGVERLVFEDLIRRADCLVVEDLAQDDDWRWAFAGRQLPQTARLVSFSADTPQEALSTLIEQLTHLGLGVAGRVHLRNHLNLHLLLLLGSVAGGPSFQGLFEFPAQGLDQEARFSLLKPFDADHAEALSGTEEPVAPEASEEASPEAAPSKSMSAPDVKARPLKSALGGANPAVASSPRTATPDRPRGGEEKDKVVAPSVSPSPTPDPQQRVKLSNAAPMPKAIVQEAPTAGEASSDETPSSDSAGERASGQSGSSDEVSIVDSVSEANSDSDASPREVLSSVSSPEDTSGGVALSKSAPSSVEPSSVEPSSVEPSQDASSQDASSQDASSQDASSQDASSQDAPPRTGVGTPTSREVALKSAGPASPSMNPDVATNTVEADASPADSASSSLADMRESGEPLTLPSSSSRPIRQAAAKALATKPMSGRDGAGGTTRPPMSLSSAVDTSQGNDGSKTSDVRRAYDRLRSISGARASSQATPESATPEKSGEPRLSLSSTPAPTSPAGREGADASFRGLASKPASDSTGVAKASQANPSPPPPPTASPSLPQGPDAAARLGRRLGRPLESRRNQTRGALFTPPPPGMGAEAGGNFMKAPGMSGVSSRHGQGPRPPISNSVQNPGNGDDPPTLDVLPTSRKDESEEEDGPTGVMNRLGSTPGQPTPPRIAGGLASPGGGRRVLSGTISRLSRRLTRPGAAQEDQKPDERGGPSTNSRRLSRYSAINRSATYKPSTGPDEALTPGALRNAKKTAEGNEDDIETIQRDTANMRPLTSKDIQNNDLDATSELDLNRVKRLIDQRNSD